MLWILYPFGPEVTDIRAGWRGTGLSAGPAPAEPPCIIGGGATGGSPRRSVRSVNLVSLSRSHAYPHLPSMAREADEKLTAVEAVLVDVHRESDRDVLRNPAGLNDTLLALISTVSLSDTVPTKPAAAVSREIMARVDAEIGKLERLAATEVAEVNRLALWQAVEGGESRLRAQ